MRGRESELLLVYGSFRQLYDPKAEVVFPVSRQ